MDSFEGSENQIKRYLIVTIHENKEQLTLNDIKKRCDKNVQSQYFLGRI